MLVPLLPLLLPSLLFLLLYRVYIHLHPLRSIPAAHPTARLSPLWLSHQKRKQRTNKALLAAHARFGPVVLVAPGQVSVNCVVGGVRTVYGFGRGGWSKSEMYGEVFGNLGTTPMVAIQHATPHATRKRMLTHIYSKSMLHTSPHLSQIARTVLYSRLLPVLHDAAETHEPVDAWSLLGGAAMDFSAGYIFGLGAGTELTTDERRRREVEGWFYGKAEMGWGGWVRGVLGVDRAVGGLGAEGKVAEFVGGMCSRAEEVLGEGGEKGAGGEVKLGHHPAVYAQLASAMAKEAATTGLGQEDVWRNLVGELMDHTLAGYETSQLTLTYLVWELSQRPEVQDALRAELRTLSPAVASPSAPRLPDSKALDALPLLHAVLWETLRKYPGTPGPQPRVTPAVEGGVTLGPAGAEYAGIPGGVVVAAAAYCLHRNEDVFPEPEEWRPERWLGADGRVLDLGAGTGTAVEEDSGVGGDQEERERAMEMGRWFWAFGSGGRMCIGNHLAIYQLKYIVAAVYTAFASAVVDDSGIEPSDSFVAHPTSHRLMVSFQEA